MSSTMKTLIFIISIFVFLAFFILINILLPPQALPYAPKAAVFKAMLYIAGYITAIYTQALLKYLYTKRHMRSLNILMTLPAKAFELRDRLIILTLPIIAVFMPMVSRREVTAENLRSLAYLAALALIIEALFMVNSRTIKAYVSDKGIAVNGADFRLELSVSFSYTNAVGWYPFERLGSYLALSNKVLLYPTYDMGVIELECSEEEARQIKGLLISKGVPERKPSMA